MVHFHPPMHLKSEDKTTVKDFAEKIEARITSKLL